jgi:hypothetical protein
MQGSAVNIWTMRKSIHRWTQSILRAPYYSMETILRISAGTSLVFPTAHQRATRACIGFAFDQISQEVVPVRKQVNPNGASDPACAHERTRTKGQIENKRQPKLQRTLHPSCVRRALSSSRTREHHTNRAQRNIKIYIYRNMFTQHQQKPTTLLKKTYSTNRVKSECYVHCQANHRKLQ